MSSEMPPEDLALDWGEVRALISALASAIANLSYRVKSLEDRARWPAEEYK